jgi:hypothetical protein
MNREDIIRMAWKAGFERLGHTGNDWVCYPEDIERFAALVASAEREAILDLVDGYAKNNTDLAEAIRARGQA